MCFLAALQKLRKHCVRATSKDLKLDRSATQRKAQCHDHEIVNLSKNILSAAE